MTIDFIKYRQQATLDIIERANRIGQNGNNIIATIDKQKQIRWMFHLKFT